MAHAVAGGRDRRRAEHRRCIPAAYHRNGWDGGDRPPAGGQRRFCDPDVETFLARVDALRGWAAAAPGVRVGVAAHSVRAVPRDLARGDRRLRRAPRPRRATSTPTSSAASSRSAAPSTAARRSSCSTAPASWRRERASIHGIHVDDDDVALLAGRGAIVVVVPDDRGQPGRRPLPGAAPARRRRADRHRLGLQRADRPVRGGRASSRRARGASARRASACSRAEGDLWAALCRTGRESLGLDRSDAGTIDVDLTIPTSRGVARARPAARARDVRVGGRDQASGVLGPTSDTHGRESHRTVRRVPCRPGAGDWERGRHATYQRPFVRSLKEERKCRARRVGAAGSGAASPRSERPRTGRRRRRPPSRRPRGIQRSAAVPHSRTTSSSSPTATSSPSRATRTTSVSSRPSRSRAAAPSSAPPSPRRRGRRRLRDQPSRRRVLGRRHRPQRHARHPSRRQGHDQVRRRQLRRHDGAGHLRDAGLPSWPAPPSPSPASSAPASTAHRWSSASSTPTSSTPTSAGVTSVPCPGPLVAVAQGRLLVRADVQRQHVHRDVRLRHRRHRRARRRRAGGERVDGLAGGGRRRQPSGPDHRRVRRARRPRHGRLPGRPRRRRRPEARHGLGRPLRRQDRRCR